MQYMINLLKNEKETYGDWLPKLVFPRHSKIFNAIPHSILNNLEEMVLIS